MEVDIGATFSVISKQPFDQMFPSYPTDVKLKTYTVLCMDSSQLLYRIMVSKPICLFMTRNQPTTVKRPIPYCIRPKVNKLIDKLLEQKIIEPVSFLDWSASIVPVVKPDKSYMSVEISNSHV